MLRAGRRRLDLASPGLQKSRQAVFGRTHGGVHNTTKPMNMNKRRQVFTDRVASLTTRTKPRRVVGRRPPTRRMLTKRL